MQNSSFNWSLDFSPKMAQAELFPVCLWQGYALNHFDRKNSTESAFTRDLSHLGLDQALLMVHPQLSFTELARLVSALISHLKPEHSVVEKVVAAYGFALDDRLLLAFEIFLQMPASFQIWSDAHALSPRDILPLAALEASQRPDDLLKIISENNLSRNYGCQILELIVDCIMLGHTLESLQPAKTGDGFGATWIDELKKIRFAETAKADTDKESRWNLLPWTKEFQTRWFRRGDQSGMEVRFTISSKSDFDRKVKSLERILGEFND